VGLGKVVQAVARGVGGELGEGDGVVDGGKFVVEKEGGRLGDSQAVVVFKENVRHVT
jgi:hypothetical protein